MKDKEEEEQREGAEETENSIDSDMEELMQSINDLNRRFKSK